MEEEGISELLWEKLDQSIGSRQVIYMRRKKRTITELVQNNDQIHVISSGSKAEGLNLPGSDEDFMMVDKAITVLPRQCNDASQADLIMDTNNVKPGFATLYLGLGQRSLVKLRNYVSALKPINGRLYLSSLLFRDIYVEMSSQLTGRWEPHGQFASFKDKNNDFQFNYMYCVSCEVWPHESQEWVQRRRMHNWPSPDLIAEIVNNGCLLVPIGNPLSQEGSIEWRLSFSLAETKLAHSMNHTQILCYGLLKLYLAHVIESREDCKGLLCSYFLKTSLFYCIEEDDVIWNKHNLINCFWTCFQRVFLWIRQGYCPNYFIRTNNMFESKIFGERQKRLSEHLRNLYENGIATILGIPVFCDLNTCILLREFGHSPNIANVRMVNEYHCDLELVDLYTDCEGNDIKTTTARITKIQRALVHPQLPPFDHTCLTFFLNSNQVSLSHHLYKFISNSCISNKSKYNRLQMLSRYIIQNCTNFDICTGWLQYATLNYLIGNNNKVILVVEYILSKFKSFVLYRGPVHTLSIEGEYIRHMCGQELTVDYKRKQAFASTYVCIPSCGFYPQEIKSEIEQHYYQMLQATLIPPRVYCYVLLFLAYRRTERTDLKNKPLDRLLESAEDRHFVTDFERPIVEALVQRCVEIATNE